MAELIQREDSLNTGREKLNEAIKASERAEGIADTALSTANTAKSTADTTREEMVEIIREQTAGGDIVPEVVQARGGELTLADRLNSSENVLSETVSELEKKANATDVGTLSELKTEVKDNLVGAVNENVEYIEEAYDFSLFPQSPKPPKAGVATNNYKIIHKRTTNNLYVTQKTNKGYVQYRLEKHNGVSVEGRDYGVNHELLRLIRARHVPQAYVYYDVSSPLIGSVETSIAPADYNTIEQMIFPSNFIDPSGNFNSGKAGLGMYRFPSGSSVTYRINSKINEKINLLFRCTAGSSDKVDIFINNQLVESFDPREYVPSYGGESSAMRLVELDVPFNAIENRLDIRIENNGVSGWCNLCAINFFRLEDYKGQHVTDYKTFGSTKSGWIENPGASDYAIRDADGKLFGSYHGGEVTLSEQIYFNTISNFPENEYSPANVPLSGIPNGAWSIQKNFYIYQQTELAEGKYNTKMVSYFDFDTDGTIEMDFAYSSDGLPLTSFRTALTSTNVLFNYITYPIRNRFPDEPTNTYYEFPITEGKVSQVSSSELLQLDIRFTRFNKRYADKGAYIADNVAYRKFYYGPLDGTSEIPLKSLTFSKGLDFIVR